MPDIFTKSQRSYVMSRIRSHGNQDTEVALARFFRQHGIIGWRRQMEIRHADFGARNRQTRNTRPKLFKVRPDFVFQRERLAVFVDGCFWHGCPRCYRRPKSNRKFWDAKIARNRERDRLVNRTLRRADWTVLRLWEHVLRRATRRVVPINPHADRLRKRILAALKP